MPTESPTATESGGAPDAYATLRIPGFRWLCIGILLFTIAVLSQEVVIGYRLYQLTHDPLSLGLIGLAEAVPFISLALFGGHFADRHDKRRIIQLAMLLFIAGTLVLLWAFSPHAQLRLPRLLQLLLIYAVIALLGLARGFLTPAAGAILPFLVPQRLYANAVAWRSSFWQAGAVIGPAAGGFLYAGIGLQGALTAVTLLLAAALAMFSRLRPRGEKAAAPREGSIWSSLREGLVFVFRSRMILYAISLDLFSVLFGGVVAILPVFASDILHVGAQGLGVLRAAPALGAMLTVVACTHFPPTRHAWRNLLLAVAGFGVATLVFALSKLFWLSLAALAATGAFDSVSVVIRQTLLQVLPPDHLRGRVYSVNSIFISSSNELGAFESGSMARLMGTVPSVVFGGAMTLATVGYCWRRGRDLFSVRLV